MTLKHSLSWITESMDRIEAVTSRLFGGGAGNANPPVQLEPVEVRVQALRKITERIQFTGRGGCYFPHAGVKLTLGDAELAGAFLVPQFQHDLIEELKERGCSFTSVVVTVSVVDDESHPPCVIEYLDELPIAREGECPEAHLTVIRGKSAVQIVRLGSGRIYLGRLEEVREKDGSIVRRNELPFDESETTVSRKHAWVQFDSGSGRFRVFNDPQSDRGTHVVRNGTVTRSDSMRGVELRGGDEIHLGNARVRFDIGQAPPED